MRLYTDNNGVFSQRDLYPSVHLPLTSLLSMEFLSHDIHNHDTLNLSTAMISKLLHLYVVHPTNPEEKIHQIFVLSTPPAQTVRTHVKVS